MAIDTYKMPCEDFDQIARTRRVIWVFAARTSSLQEMLYSGSFVLLHELFT